MSKEDLAETDDLEIETLSDEELNSVAGGAAAEGTYVASCICCGVTIVTFIDTE